MTVSNVIARIPGCRRRIVNLSGNNINDKRDLLLSSFVAAEGMASSASSVAKKIFGHACFMLVLSASILGSAVAVHITALRVPAVVRNGSRAGAVLDCEYALGAREQRRLASETGLVVKWFLVGSGPAPVYQWIPGQRPQDFGALRGRVDLAFKVTGSDERGAHRALRIPTPTTDLSGEYKCSVSTFEDEDFMVKRMLVFAPEQSLELVQYKPQESAVNVTCSARGVYPEPKLALSWSSGERDAGYSVNQRSVFPLEGVSTRATIREGAYDVVSSKLLQDEDLPSPTIFDCQLRIPEADYIVRKSIVYYPNGSGPASSSGCKSFWIGSSEMRIAVTLVAVLVFPAAVGNLFVRVQRYKEPSSKVGNKVRAKRYDFPVSAKRDAMPVKERTRTHVSTKCNSSGPP